MADWLHMLGAMVAGMLLTLLVVDAGGLGAGLLALAPAGWVMATYDHNYQRVMREKMQARADRKAGVHDGPGR